MNLHISGFPSQNLVLDPLKIEMRFELVLRAQTSDDSFRTTKMQENSSTFQKLKKYFEILKSHPQIFNKPEKNNEKWRNATFKNHRKIKIWNSKNQNFPNLPKDTETKPTQLCRLQKSWETVEKQKC